MTVSVELIYVSKWTPSMGFRVSKAKKCGQTVVGDSLHAAFHHLFKQLTSRHDDNVHVWQFHVWVLVD